MSKEEGSLLDRELVPTRSDVPSLIENLLHCAPRVGSIGLLPLCGGEIRPMQAELSLRLLDSLLE